MKNKKQPAEIKGLAKLAKRAKFDPAPPTAEENDIKAIPVPIQSVSITDLRVKLKAKIASLRHDRGADNPRNKQDLLEKRLVKKKPVPKSSIKRKVEEITEDSTAVNSDEDAAKNKRVKTVVDDVFFGVLNFGDEKKKTGIDTMSKLKKVFSFVIAFYLRLKASKPRWKKSKKRTRKRQSIFKKNRNGTSYSVSQKAQRCKTTQSY